MKLFNVRLSEEDAARVAELRREGVELSTLVREALRARHLELRSRLGQSDVREVLASICSAYPLAEEAERLEVDTTNRRTTRELIRRKLTRKRSA
jgi:hypothetical protein